MTDAERKITSIHDAKGRFAPGNPGRPKGAKARASRDLLLRVKQLGPDAVDKLTEAVTAGERWAIEMVLAHTLPSSRAIEWEGATPEDIRAAIVNGDIGADEAARLTTALAKIAEIEDLEAIRTKLDELEQAVRDAK